MATSTLFLWQFCMVWLFYIFLYIKENKRKHLTLIAFSPVKDLKVYKCFYLETLSQHPSCIKWFKLFTMYWFYWSWFPKVAGFLFSCNLTIYWSPPSFAGIFHHFYTKNIFPHKTIHQSSLPLCQQFENACSSTEKKSKESKILNSSF